MITTNRTDKIMANSLRKLSKLGYVEISDRNAAMRLIGFLSKIDMPMTIVYYEGIFKITRSDHDVHIR